MNRLRFRLFLLAGLSLFATTAAEARNPLPKRERDALLTLYQATRGDQWRHRDGWLGPPGTECDWFGVECGDDADPNASVAYVAILNLPNNQLRGPLPRRMGKLGRLLELNLSGNQLQGPIPRDLGALKQLRSLELTANRFSGEIPRALGSLSQLEILLLGYNRLTGAPPPELANLKKVLFLSLSGNLLSGPLPAWVGGLDNVVNLELCPNDFSGPIPLEIFRPRRLGELALLGCHLSGRIPSAIGSAPNLTDVFLEGNQLTGQIPDSILQLQHVSVIHLDWNALRTDNEELVAFLDARTSRIAWRSTQTLPPTDPEAMATGPTKIRLSWTPVNYFPGFFNAAGGYTIYASTSPLGPFASIKSVSGKATQTVEITGLSASTTYYFRIDTFSLPHEENPNLVRSQRTLIVSARTLAK